MIADRIKMLRTTQNMSQIQLARKLNISRTSVNSWELGISRPTAVYLVELSKVFGVSTDYLLGLDTNAHVDISNLTTEQANIVVTLIEHFKKENEK